MTIIVVMELRFTWKVNPKSNGYTSLILLAGLSVLALPVPSSCRLLVFDLDAVLVLSPK